MSTDTGGPAFPHHIEHPNGHWPGVTHAGMTLRDYFAAKVVQALWQDKDWGEDLVDQAARIAYSQADAMLKARKEQ